MNFYEYNGERARVSRILDSLNVVKPLIGGHNPHIEQLLDDFNKRKVYMENYLRDRRRTGKTTRFVQRIVSDFKEQGFAIIPLKIGDIYSVHGLHVDMLETRKVYLDYPLDYNTQSVLIKLLTNDLEKYCINFKIFSYDTCVVYFNPEIVKVDWSYNLTDSERLFRLLNGLPNRAKGDVIINFEMEYPFDFEKQDDAQYLLYKH